MSEKQRLIRNLLLVVTAFTEVRPIATTTLGRLFFNDGKYIDAIQRPGADFSIETYDAGMTKLSRGWPEGARWPPMVERPPIRPPRPDRKGKKWGTK